MKIKQKTTKQVIADMLHENTGTHMLDSGGAYGRHWQQNQEIDFGKQPPVVLDITGGYIDYTRNLYHFLSENLEYAPKMQKRFDRFIEKREDTYYLQDMQDFAEAIKAKGLYGEGAGFIVNSYNGECNLSQTIQFMYFEDNGAAYVLLQVHNGCDVRGGYTSPKAFSVEDESFLSLADGYLYCKNGHNWQTDDCYNWYSGGEGNDIKNDMLEELRDENKVECSEGIEALVNWNKAHRHYQGRADFDKVFYNVERNELYCPICGEVLAA